MSLPLSPSLFPSLSLFLFLVKQWKCPRRRSITQVDRSYPVGVASWFVSTRSTCVIIACVSWMMGWYAYSRGNRRGNPRPWISSPSVVRNDPRSCRENLSRPLVLGSRQEPRGLQREGEARRYVGGGEDGVGGRRWWIVVVAGWRWRWFQPRGERGMRRVAGGNARERAEVFCPTRTRLWLDHPRFVYPGHPSPLPPPPPPLSLAPLPLLLLLLLLLPPLLLVIHLIRLLLCTRHLNLLLFYRATFYPLSSLLLLLVRAT